MLKERQKLKYEMRKMKTYRWEQNRKGTES